MRDLGGPCPTCGALPGHQRLAEEWVDPGGIWERGARMAQRRDCERDLIAAENAEDES